MKAYHIVIRSNSENISNLHKISLFINGFDDIKTSINYYRPFDNAQISVGQYRTVKSFCGHVANMILFLYPVTDDEVSVLN